MVLEVYVVASVLKLTCTPTCVVTKLARIQVARSHLKNKGYTSVFSLKNVLDR